MNKQTGFSLIELLVVLTIIALLGAVVGPQIIGNLGSARSNATKIQIEDFGAALDLFYLDNGRYPTTEEGLRALVAEPANLETWDGPYLKKSILPQDAWHNDYRYEAPGRNGSYDLYSYGADNTPGGEGENRDLVSWE